MNYTVIPKSIVNFQTGNSKPIDIYVWATIKYCSNHKTNISHITEEKLSLLTELDERTIRRSIKRLKDAGYLTVHTTIKEDADRGFIKRNSYYIKPANKDYFFLDNSFFKRNYPAKIAGFLLLLKSVCLIIRIPSNDATAKLQRVSVYQEIRQQPSLKSVCN